MTNDLTVSQGLIGYLENKSNSGMAISKVADALSITALSDRNLLSFMGLVDDYYLSLGFKPAESSRTDEKFAFRLYRHLSGSSAQVMAAQEMRFTFHLFVNDFEDSIAYERRNAMKLSENMDSQNHGQN